MCDPTLGVKELSVIVITKNEARNTGAYVDNDGFAGPWIIVESTSRNGTAGQARAADSRVIAIAG